MRKDMMAVLAVIVTLNASIALAVGQPCQEAVKPQLQDDKNMKLWVHEFEPGKYDLAMSKDEVPENIKRVSFSGADAACIYRPIAIERGGDWGWHLVWAEQGEGVFYARMDGEAWVSSPKKRIVPSPAEKVELKISGQHLEIHWQDDVGQRLRQKSPDEGRSWD